MGGQFFNTGTSSGFQYEKQNSVMQGKSETGEGIKKRKEKDDDLIIEENTIYEVDRECYERLKKLKKRKEF